MINLKEFLNKESFSEQIEQKVLDGQTYFDAVLEFAEDADKSPEELIQFMSQVMIEKVRQSAVDAGMIDLKEGNLDSFLE